MERSEIRDSRCVAATPHSASLHAGYYLISHRADGQTGGQSEIEELERMSFAVPAPRETFDVDLEDGAKIGVRRHGNPNGVRLTVTHGNGFAADAYLPFWQLLIPNY